MSIDEKIQYIIENIENAKKVVRKAYEVKSELIPLTLDGHITETQFYSITSLLTPQSRSPLWERYFIEKSNAEKIPLHENKGDLMLNESAYEYKASGFNQDNKLHLVQIRLWQQCGYIIQSIQPNKVYTFSLTHQQMKKETITCKATAAHGTEHANKNNENIELRFTIEPSGVDWKRWIKLYLV